MRRSKRVIVPPKRFSPEELVEDDFSESDYNTDDSGSDINTSDEEDNSEEENDNGSDLEDFIVSDDDDIEYEASATSESDDATDED